MGGYDSGVPDLSPLAAFRAMVESARDIESPAERRRVLRLFSSQLTQLQAEVERINDQTDLAEQGAALGAEFDMLQARSDADLRDELICRGLASDEDLDKEGVLSHEELDAAAADPAIREGLFGAGAGLAAKFEERLHPRGRGGKFADKPGGPPQPPARRRPAPPKPQNPGSGTTGYTDKAKELDARVKEKSRAGVKDRDAESAVDATLGGPKKPQNPGSKGPVANAAAPRWAGHASQQELLAYSRQAATQATTVDAYADRAPDGSLVFDESRKQLHEQIISKLLDSIPAQAAGQARVMFTGGGYSAGKGGVLNGHPDAIPDGNDPKGADDPQRGLVLDPDVIKALLPEFDAMLDSDPEANLLVYEEAWHISQELQRRAIAKNVNMTVDGISDTSKDDMLGRVKLFTDAKYQHPKVVYVDIPTDEAIKRAANRAAKAKKRSDRRFIPEVIMRAVHRDVAATIPEVMKAAASAGLDVEVWDNNQGWDAANDRPIPPVMIARSAESGVETIGDLGEALWKALLAKGQEKISGVDDIAEAASDEEAGMDEQSTDTGGEGAEQGTGEVVDGYIDLPYESGSSDPQPLEYADLGPDKKYVPGEDFREAQKRAGSSGGEGEDGRGDSAKE